MAFNPHAAPFVPVGQPRFHANAPEFVPEAERQRRAAFRAEVRENNARSFNEMMREINAARAQNLGAGAQRKRKTRKTRKNRKSRKNRR